MRKIGEYAAWVSSEGDISVSENVSLALGGEVSRCDCEHVGSAAESTSEEQDVGVTSRRDQEWAEAVNAFGDAEPF